ncbi:MAG: hypothetical protein IPO19_22895 [Rhodoferax sp.]|nr:hypothetical protein [Rhodoferax sp.]
MQREGPGCLEVTRTLSAELLLIGSLAGDAAQALRSAWTRRWTAALRWSVLPHEVAALELARATLPSAPRTTTCPTLLRKCRYSRHGLAGSARWPRATSGCWLSNSVAAGAGAGDQVDLRVGLTQLVHIRGGASGRARKPGIASAGARGGPAPHNRLPRACSP